MEKDKEAETSRPVEEQERDEDILSELTSEGADAASHDDGQPATDPLALSAEYGAAGESALGDAGGASVELPADAVIAERSIIKEVDLLMPDR